MDKSYADQCLERAAKAHRMLCDVCADKHKFVMSIPVQKDDTDMVIQASLDDSVELAHRLKRAIKYVRMLDNNFLFADELAELEAAPGGDEK